MTKKSLSTRKAILLCVNAALEKKGKNITILNIKKISSIADYLIICNGSSDRQVQSIAASIEENMKKEKALPIGVEGDRIGKWVLLDYGDILIHVFYEPVRSFYDLESLWPDAPRMDVDDNATRIKGLRKGM